jgi:hypothetical protein
MGARVRGPVGNSAHAVCAAGTLTVSVNEEYVGVPKDGAWDQFAAFMSINCIEHGK